MGLSRSFWRNKNVFVTGHTGFKGGWLCLWLELLGAKVTGYALRPPTLPSFYESACVGKGLRSITANIEDGARLTEEIKRAKPEIIFHLAAQSLVKESYRDPMGTYRTNVNGAVNLLQAAREVKSIRALTLVTSDKCYENSGKPKYYKEEDPLGGFDPYSSSKACQEILAAAWRNSFNIPIATARAGNVIGGGDWAKDRLVPDIMRALLAKKTILIRRPKAIRPWQHVLDPLYGYLLLAENLYKKKEAFAGPWNFGPASKAPKPVSWIVERLVSSWGAGARWKIVASPHHEAPDLRLDASKALKKLGWKSRLEINEALEWSVEWVRCYEKNGDIRNLSLSQIRRYESL